MSTSDCSYAEPFALQVLGDSMEPEFPDKCVIVVAPTDPCYNGAYVVIEVDGERWFRQYVEDQDGNRKLIAANPAYPEIPLAGTRHTILGVTIQRNIRRKVKHYHPGTDGKGQAYPLES